MADRETPIVLVASGTATRAAATYARIEADCRKRFPGHPIHWAYSSRAIRRRIAARRGEAPPTPASVLEALHRAGGRQAVVQSLHLITGIEFHHLVWQAARSPLDVHLGLPLLAHPEDFTAIIDWIDSIAPAAGEEALVLVGHGTAHPAWMAYDLLARQIADRWGPHIQLGQVKGEPSSSAVAERLKTAGYRRATLRPFMLVAGAHFMQDLAGDRPGAWQTQLARQGLSVTPVAEGLGAHPSVIAIFCRHIQAALNARPLRLD
jgi:sirohydrochlorin cobaltochelatase